MDDEVDQKDDNEEDVSESNVMENNENKEIHKTVKNSLKKIVRSRDVSEKLGEVASACNLIVGHGSRLLSLFLYFYVEQTNSLPITSLKKLISFCFKRVKREDGKKEHKSAKSNDLFEQVKKFYEKYYKATITRKEKQIMSMRNIDQPLRYETTALHTAYKNNAMCHYVEYVENFVNEVFEKRSCMEKLNGKKEKGEFCRRLQHQKDLILLRSQEGLDPKLVKHFPHIICSNPYRNESLKYHLKACPLEFLLPMVYMQQQKALLNKDCKLYNPFPTRTVSIPPYVTIDTVALVDLFYKVQHYKIVGDKTQAVKSNLTDYADALWALFFKTDKPVLKERNKSKNKSKVDMQSFIFNHSISTDGVGCSTSYVRKDKSGKDCKSKKKRNTDKAVKKPNKRPSKKENSDDKDDNDKDDKDDKDDDDDEIEEDKKGTSKKRKEKYVDDLTVAEKNALLKKRIVCIDPNKGNLLYCMARGDHSTLRNRDYILKKGNTLRFRYTQEQRKKESKQDVYRKRMENLKLDTTIGGKTVVQIEAELSEFNHKACTFETHLNYVRKKNQVSQKLYDFYQQLNFRKMRWHKYVNTQRSEANMINRFAEVFGRPKDAVVFFGDWSQRKQMRFREPTKGIGFRDLFRKFGYAVYLVDEYGTSVNCCVCKGQNTVAAANSSSSPTSSDDDDNSEKADETQINEDDHDDEDETLYGRNSYFQKRRTRRRCQCEECREERHKNKLRRRENRGKKIDKQKAKEEQKRKKRQEKKKQTTEKSEKKENKSNPKAKLPYKSSNLLCFFGSASANNTKNFVVNSNNNNAACHLVSRNIVVECSQNKQEYCHGLLVCKTCTRKWNRDVNSALNQLFIVESALNGLNRPAYLARGNKVSGRKVKDNTLAGKKRQRDNDVIVNSVSPNKINEPPSSSTLA